MKMVEIVQCEAGPGLTPLTLCVLRGLVGSVPATLHPHAEKLPTESIERPLLLNLSVYLSL